MQREYTYSVFVSPEVDGVDQGQFRKRVQEILQHNMGWRKWKYAFDLHDQLSVKQSYSRGDTMQRHFTLTLTPDEEISQYGPEFRGMSVANCSQNRVSINATRWKTGAKPNPTDPVDAMPLEDYRMYVILHEVGHILSHCSHKDHKRACSPSGKAPIMMQQTNGVGAGCSPNPYPVDGIDNIEADKIHHHKESSVDESSE